MTGVLNSLIFGSWQKASSNIWGWTFSIFRTIKLLSTSIPWSPRNGDIPNPQNACELSWISSGISCLLLQIDVPHQFGMTAVAAPHHANSDILSRVCPILHRLCCLELFFQYFQILKSLHAVQIEMTKINYVIEYIYQICSVLCEVCFLLEDSRL